MYIYHKFESNVGKYVIHGASGYGLDINPKFCNEFEPNNSSSLSKYSWKSDGCCGRHPKKNMMKFQAVFPLSPAGRIDGVNPLQVTNKYKLLKLPHPFEGNLRFFNRKQ